MGCIFHIANIFFFWRQEHIEIFEITNSWIECYHSKLNAVDIASVLIMIVIPWCLFLFISNIP